MKLQFTGENCKALDPQGWSASHTSNDCTAWAPLHADGEVVALVVLRGDSDDLIPRLIELGKQIESASAAAAPAPAVVQAEVSEAVPTVAPVDAAYLEVATAMHAAQDKLATALALLNELSLLWHDDHKIATLNSRQYPTTTMEFDEVMEKIEEFTLPERLK